MHLHKIKSNRGKLEGIVLTTMEFAENLANLKFSSAAKLLFEIRSKEVELLESETQAPGREVAYISMLRSKFDSAP